MSVYEMAIKYYPFLWSIDRLRMLVENKKLSAEEFEKITGKQDENKS